jgi:hypothetical protein
VPAKEQEERIAVMLKHWLEHNDRHAEEFRAWAERARALGRSDVSQGIVQAAEQMLRVNEWLDTALRRLRKG